MFLSDFLRGDTAILLLMVSAGGPVGSGELSDALAEIGIDADRENLLRELKKMQSRALVTFTGYTLRGTTRVQLYECTDLGRATINRRSAVLRTLLLDPPAVRDVDAQQAAAGWT